MPAGGRIKYYVLNKEIDYQKGFMENMTYKGTGISADNGFHGVFISHVFDGKEQGCIWHRICFGGMNESTVSIRLRFYASDTYFINQDDRQWEIDDLISLSSDQVPFETKMELFSQSLKLDTQAQESILLHQVQGRYMWFVATTYCPFGEHAGFYQVSVYFPKRTWMDYLPEIYQSSDNNGFLERYLSIFQSLYDNLYEKITNIPIYLDAESTDMETLTWLAKWLGIGNISLWNEKQLRYLVAHGNSMYRKRGTKEGLSEFIKLYTGEEPFIVEQHHIQRFADNEKHYALLRNLYGNEPCVFTILLQASCLPTGKEYSDLTRIIEEIKPAWMDFKIITLRPYILLDSYSYLGVNSILGQYLPAQLNGFSMLSFATVGEND